MANDFTDSFDKTTVRNCVRLARTEFNHIAGQATMKSLKETGIVDEYQFIATLDEKTCEVCGPLDLEHFPLTEQRPGVNMHPMHPNCRCASSSYFPPDEVSKLFNKAKRAARDPVSGKTYYVPADMTYKQWRESLTEEQGRHFMAKQTMGLTAAGDGGRINSGGDYVKILPRADEVVIPDSKIRGYSLDPIKSRGKSVAFQEALGYNLNNADELADNIRRNIKNFPVESKGDKGYGETYSVVMELTGANGKTANVMTAWIDDANTGEMRLTSTYVKKKRREL